MRCASVARRAKLRSRILSRPCPKHCHATAAGASITFHCHWHWQAASLAAQHGLAISPPVISSSWRLKARLLKRCARDPLLSPSIAPPLAAGNCRRDPSLSPPPHTHTPFANNCLAPASAHFSISPAVDSCRPAVDRPCGSGVRNKDRSERGRVGRAPCTFAGGLWLIHKSGTMLPARQAPQGVRHAWRARLWQGARAFSSPSNITRECPHPLLILQGNVLTPF